MSAVTGEPKGRRDSRTREQRKRLVQEGRRQEAGGRREESLYSKLFNLFELVGYFRRAVLAPH
jgi:hypothetical protein